MNEDKFLKESELKKLRELLFSSKNIAIISHKNPDGDTLGSNLALRYYLKSIAKNVESFCIDKPKDIYGWMPEIENFKTEGGFPKFDLIMSVDASSPQMIAFEIKPHINIDHHISNTNFAENNFVVSSACSTSFIIYKIFRYFSWPVTKNTATALLTGLYFDTGSFMHSNTSAEVLKMASELAKSGADKNKIVKALFRTMTIPQIKLWGRILEKIKTTDKGITVSVVTTEDLSECGASSEETDRVIDFLNMSEEGRFCVLLVEKNELIKGSMRTREEGVDLSSICRILGGGGHKKAGGFGVPGKIIEEEIIRISKSNF